LLKKGTCFIAKATFNMIVLYVSAVVGTCKGKMVDVVKHKWNERVRKREK